MRLGLRAKTSAAFAAGALGVCATVSIGSYELTRRALIAERERTAVRAAYFDAAVVRQSLASEDPGVVDILRTLDTGQTRRPLIYRHGEWFARSADAGSTSAVPTSLRALVQHQVPGIQRVRVNGSPSLVVGVPLPGARAEYYELTVQTELERTLRQVALSLLAVAVATTVAAALLGQWASRRLLRPLTSVAHAARSLGRGDLTARLEPAREPDLEPLTHSFNDMADDLQARIERDRRFAGDVSHELRSPLMTLAASAEVMVGRRDEMPERAQAALDLLVGDVTRFQGLVEDLLEISRFDAGAIRLHLEDLLVGEFVRQAVAVSSLPATPVHVTERAETMVMRGDRRRLARVLANLIDNARIHGGGSPTVTVMEPEGDVEPLAHVWIAVEDHGPGVGPDERELIFERFARGGVAGRRTSTDGAGLGLALVEEHIRMHGGRVWVEDRPDGEPGARFVIELPAEEVGV